MKKNLLAIIILALLVVNIVLTSIMMFSVTGAAQKTSAFVTDVTSVLKLDMSGQPGEAGEETPAVPIKNTTSYNIPDAMTIPLKTGADGGTHYIVVQVSLSLNNKHKDYKKYDDGDLTDTLPMIQNEIINVFGEYTIDQVRDEADTQGVIKKEILERLHAIYDSDFIYNVSFRDIKYS